MILSAGVLNQLSPEAMIALAADFERQAARLRTRAAELIELRATPADVARRLAEIAGIGPRLAAGELAADLARELAVPMQTFELLRRRQAAAERRAVARRRREMACHMRKSGATDSAIAAALSCHAKHVARLLRPGLPRRVESDHGPQDDAAGTAMPLRFEKRPRAGQIPQVERQAQAAGDRARRLAQLMADAARAGIAPHVKPPLADEGRARPWEGVALERQAADQLAGALGNQDQAAGDQAAHPSAHQVGVRLGKARPDTGQKIGQQQIRESGGIGRRRAPNHRTMNSTATTSAAGSTHDGSGFAV